MFARYFSPRYFAPTYFAGNRDASAGEIRDAAIVRRPVRRREDPAPVRILVPGVTTELAPEPEIPALSRAAAGKRTLDPVAEPAPERAAFDLIAHNNAAIMLLF